MLEQMKFRSIDMRGLLGHGLNDVKIKYAPQTIYYKGVTPIPFKRARVSVIGTRNPTETGIADAKYVAKALVEEGVAVVSGLGEGIDTVAHRTAMDEGGETTAVIATPLDRVHPRQNADLQQEIMDKHMVISQYPVGHTTTQKDFVSQNRTMALISNASVIVEAEDGSDVLHHGWETLRLGKYLFICQSAFQNKELKWPRELEKYGAVELVDMDQIFEFTPPNIPLEDRLRNIPLFSA